MHLYARLNNAPSRCPCLISSVHECYCVWLTGQKKYNEIKDLDLWSLFWNSNLILSIPLIRGQRKLNFRCRHEKVEGSAWDNAARSHCVGIQTTARTRKDTATDSHQSLQNEEPCQHLDLAEWTSWTKRKYICNVLSHSLCHDFQSSKWNKAGILCVNIFPFYAATSCRKMTEFIPVWPW